MKQFQAYASGGFKVVADNPRAAALLFFQTYPTKRKCTLIEGVKDGHFFCVTYGRASEGNWPQSFKDITKKRAALLPE